MSSEYLDKECVFNHSNITFPKGMNQTKHKLNYLSRSFVDLFNKLIIELATLIPSFEKQFDFLKGIANAIDAIINNQKYTFISNSDFVKMYYLLLHHKYPLDINLVINEELKSELNSLTFMELNELHSYLDASNGSFKPILSPKCALLLEKLRTILDNQDEIISHMIRIIGSYYMVASKVIKNEINIGDFSKYSREAILLSKHDAISPEDIDNLKNFRSILESFMDELTKRISKIKVDQKIIADLSIRISQAIDKVEPFNFSNEEAKMLGNSVCYDVYQLITYLQMKKYHRLTASSNASKNDLFKDILSKYGINPKIFEEKNIAINSHNISSIKDILSLLSSIGYDFKNNSNNGLIMVLTSSMISQVNEIVRLIQKGIISLEMAYKYPQIFLNIASDGLFEQIMSNYAIVKNYSSIIPVEYQEAMILIPTKELENNRLFCEYYRKIFPVTNSLLFLLNKDMYDIADYLIELGLDTSKLDLSSLIGTNVLVTLKRIKIASNIGIDIFTSKNKLQDNITSADDFIVPNSELDKYLIDVDVNHNFTIDSDLFENRLVKYLDDNYLINGVYVFEDICVSRSRFLRNLTACEEVNIDSVLQSLIKYGNYDVSDIEKIHCMINNMIK